MKWSVELDRVDVGGGVCKTNQPTWLGAGKSGGTMIKSYFVYK